MKSLIRSLLEQESPESPESMMNRSRENSFEEAPIGPTNLGRLEAERGWEEIHGFLGKEEWETPLKVCHCDKEARPGYVSKMAHEYEEDPYVLRQKVTLLCSLLTESRACVVYTGAGISTAAGISDYATKSEKPSVIKPKLRSNLDAEPTVAHRAVVGMYKAGLIKYWVQQNHDGLPQKAGFPQEAINEIHGAWYDPSNSVVPMNGSIRSDLFDSLLEWEDRADLTICMGTSMCGMNADRIFTTVANKSRRGLTIGGVIIGIQRTQYDHLSCLRIFASIDDVMQLVLNELGLFIVAYSPFEMGSIAQQCQQDRHVFRLPYDTKGVLRADLSRPSAASSSIIPCRLRNECAGTGERTNTSSSSQNLEHILLDLRPGAMVKITTGPYAGDSGEVIGCTTHGHYRIRFTHFVDGRSTQTQKVVNSVDRLLGLWWIDAAARAAAPTIPVVNIRRQVR